MRAAAQRSGTRPHRVPRGSTAPSAGTRAGDRYQRLRGPAPERPGRTISEDATPCAPGSLRRGMRVFHRRFGSGIVEECDGPDKVVARFKGFGSKKVMQQFLTIED